MNAQWWHQRSYQHWMWENRKTGSEIYIWNCIVFNLGMSFGNLYQSFNVNSLLEIRIIIPNRHSLTNKIPKYSNSGKKCECTLYMNCGILPIPKYCHKMFESCTRKPQYIHNSKNGNWLDSYI